MASLKFAKYTQLKSFKLLDGMELRVDVFGFVSQHNAKVKLELHNCSKTWTLHWGCISIGNKKWFIPAVCPSGTRVHNKNAMRTPFVKNGDAYVVVIELKDPKIHAIEFVLKDTKNDKWLKNNGGNFQIKLPEEIEVEHDDAGIAECLLNEISNEKEVEKPTTHRDSCSSAFSSTWKRLSLMNDTCSNMYAMSLEEPCGEMVGEKFRSIRFLRGEAPSWIRFPASIIIPFGVFERILSEDINKEVAKKIVGLHEHVDRGDISKLKTIQETILQMKAPRRMQIEVRKKMKSSRIPWPRGPGEDTWNRAWEAMKKVWASKWNERAYISCQKTSMNDENGCMDILIQEHIRADYAFVTYTKNPVCGNTSEIYTEIVKGSGETLVGAFRGRPLSYIAKKCDLKSPIVICYPSKSTGLYTRAKRSVIFRPDFVPQKIKGYAGAGIYDSVCMEKMEEIVLDYSRDRMIIDVQFQTSILTRIAEAGKIIEDMYGCAQDIQGIVQDGQVYVIQCSPLIT